MREMLSRAVGTPNKDSAFNKTPRATVTSRSGTGMERGRLLGGQAKEPLCEDHSGNSRFESGQSISPDSFNSIEFDRIRFMTPEQEKAFEAWWDNESKWGPERLAEYHLAKSAAEFAFKYQDRSARQECAEICRKRSITCEENALNADPDDITYLRSLAWQFGVLANDIQATIKEPTT
jgi:hypothetical protein